MRKEIDACTSAQIPLQLRLWIPEVCDKLDKTEANEGDVVIIDLVTDDEPNPEHGVIVIEL